jgi:hypothetical protein
MIFKIIAILARISIRYGGASGKFYSVFSEDSKYNIYKKAQGFRRNNQVDYEISKATFYKMRNKGLVIDGTKGGLIVGPSHEEGGVLVVREYLDKILVVAELEGYEYFINAKASKQYYSEIEKINSAYEQRVDYVKFASYKIPATIRVIDVQHKKVDGKSERPLLLMRQDQWCVNRLSSKEYLKQLDQMNNKCI